MPTPSTFVHALSADGAPVPIRWVEDLFDRLAAIFGGAMANVYASADPAKVKEEWAAALAGFSPDEVKRGLAATRMRRFAPNLGEFLHLCRPALDPELGWIEAEKGLKAHAEGERFAWSHPAVFWAAKAMAYEIRSMPFGQVRKRWDALLGEWFAVGHWPSIPDPTSRRIAAAEDEIEDPEARARGKQRLREWREAVQWLRVQGTSQP